MKGYCIDNERRIQREELSGCFPVQNILGSKVMVISITGQNNTDFEKFNDVTIFTVKDLAFIVSIDGKCFTLIYLEECPDRAFTLEDIRFIEIGTL